MNITDYLQEFCSLSVTTTVNLGTTGPQCTKLFILLGCFCGYITQPLFELYFLAFLSCLKNLTRYSQTHYTKCDALFATLNPLRGRAVALEEIQAVVHQAVLPVEYKPWVLM